MNNHRQPRPYIRREFKKYRKSYKKGGYHEERVQGARHIVPDVAFNDERRARLRKKPALVTIRENFDHIEYLDDAEVLHDVYVVRVKDAFYIYVYRSDSQLIEFSSWDAFGDWATHREIFGSYEAMLEFVKRLWGVDRFDMEIRKNIDHQSWYDVPKNDRYLPAPVCVNDTLGWCTETNVPTKAYEIVRHDWIQDWRFSGKWQRRPNEQEWQRACEDGFANGLDVGRYNGLAEALELAKSTSDIEALRARLMDRYNDLKSSNINSKGENWGSDEER